MISWGGCSDKKEFVFRRFNIVDKNNYLVNFMLVRCVVICLKIKSNSWLSLAKLCRSLIIPLPNKLRRAYTVIFYGCL